MGRTPKEKQGFLGFEGATVPVENLMSITVSRLRKTCAPQFLLFTGVTFYTVTRDTELANTKPSLGETQG